MMKEFVSTLVMGISIGFLLTMFLIATCVPDRVPVSKIKPDQCKIQLLTQAKQYTDVCGSVINLNEVNPKE